MLPSRAVRQTLPAPDRALRPRAGRAAVNPPAGPAPPDNSHKVAVLPVSKRQARARDRVASRKAAARIRAARKARNNRRPMAERRVLERVPDPDQPPALGQARDRRLPDLQVNQAQAVLRVLERAPELDQTQVPAQARDQLLQEHRENQAVAALRDLEPVRGAVRGRAPVPQAQAEALVQVQARAPARQEAGHLEQALVQARGQERSSGFRPARGTGHRSQSFRAQVEAVTGHPAEALQAPAPAQVAVAQGPATSTLWVDLRPATHRARACH